MLFSLFALIPGPIIYGIVIDNTCLAWSNKCGVRGNCQLYDKTKFRLYINVLSITLTIIATLLDLLVWHYSKSLNLYDEETTRDSTQNNSKQNQRQIQPLLDECHEKI